MGRVLKLTILGSGSSTGVPRIGGNWGACDPSELRNRRRRCSLLVETGKPGGEPTTVLIDTSPDMHAQLVDAGTRHVDAVLYTHDHADQTHGIDDLRQIALINKARVPVYGDARTLASLKDRFGYCFESQPGSFYRPILDAFDLPRDGGVVIDGPGGRIDFQALEVEHGATPTLGFVIEGRVGYTPDAAEISEAAFDHLHGLEYWICDALQWTPHGTHSHVDKSLKWFERAGIQKGVLTNLHLSLDYKTLKEYVPVHVDVAYDGMELTLEIP